MTAPRVPRPTRAAAWVMAGFLATLLGTWALGVVLIVCALFY
jgi:hypothetical protein